MDLLDFEADQLYFDEPIDPLTKQLINEAAGFYGKDVAEQLLLRAYFLEPEHPLVLVALYRYFYYQQRYQDALKVADRVLCIFSHRLAFPDDWRKLDFSYIENGEPLSVTLLRFYMLTLKGAGYLELRLGNHAAALERLQKVVDLDESDRLGAQSLLELARNSMATSKPQRALT